MHEPSSVCFGKGPADLNQDRDHARWGLGAREYDQLVQRQPVDVFHGVIKDAAFGAPEVVDLNRTRVRQLAGELRLSLELQQAVFAGAVRSDQLDGGGPA